MSVMNDGDHKNIHFFEEEEEVKLDVSNRAVNRMSKLIQIDNYD